MNSMDLLVSIITITVCIHQPFLTRHKHDLNPDFMQDAKHPAVVTSVHMFATFTPLFTYSRMGSCDPLSSRQGEAALKQSRFVWIK